MACCSDHLRVPTGSSVVTVQRAEGDGLALVTDCAGTAATSPGWEQ